MKSKVLSIILKVIGILLIVSAIGLTVYNVAVDYFSGKRVEKILEKMNIELDNRNHDTITDETNINDYSANDEMPTIDIDGKKYIGIITIPSVNINLPVLKDYSYENLKIAPALYKGTIYNNNAIIAAHSYSSQFKRIQQLKIGDLVTFEDVDGHIFHYKVIKKERLFKNEIELMTSGEWDLTLFTCTTMSDNYRATIRLKLINE